LKVEDDPALAGLAWELGATYALFRDVAWSRFFRFES